MKIMKKKLTSMQRKLLQDVLKSEIKRKINFFDIYYEMLNKQEGEKYANEVKELKEILIKDGVVINQANFEFAIYDDGREQEHN